jgi:hypothetical protein
MPRSSVLKKTVIASERDRPDIARRRAQWIEHQSRIKPERLVFIDETWTKTNMASGDGRRAEQGSWPKFRTAIGKP